MNHSLNDEKENGTIFRLSALLYVRAEWYCVNKAFTLELRRLSTKPLLSTFKGFYS